MASLELLVDNTGLLSGSGAARTELDRLIQKGTATESSMGKVSQSFTATGASMRDAFGAAKGGLQVTQGLQAVTDGFASAAAGAAGFSTVANAAGRVLLEISKSRDEWRNLSTSMQSVTTISQVVERDMFGVATGVRDVATTTRTAQSGFGALWSVLRANPITSIAAALGVAATAMNLFGESADKAAAGYGRLSDTIGRSASEVDVARMFGDESLSAGAAKKNLSALYQQAVEVRSGGRNVTVKNFANSLGPDVGAGDIWDALADLGDQQALMRRQLRQTDDGDRATFAYEISPERQIELLRRRATSFGLPDKTRPGGAAFNTNSLLWYRPPGEGAAAGGSEPDYEGFGPYLPGTTGDAMARAGRIAWDSDRQEESDRQRLRAMEALEASAQRTGAYLGDAATALVTKAATAQQILQQIFTDVLRSGLTTALTGATKSFLQGFGATPAQAQS